MKTGDWPSYVEEELEIYEPEELARFFSACTVEEHGWFQFFLMAGMREQEVLYCSWKNVNPTGVPVVMTGGSQHADDNLSESCGLVFKKLPCGPQTGCLRSVIRYQFGDGNFGRATGFQSAAHRDGSGPITNSRDAPASRSSYRITGMESGLPFRVAD